MPPRLESRPADERFPAACAQRHGNAASTSRTRLDAHRNLFTREPKGIFVSFRSRTFRSAAGGGDKTPSPPPAKPDSPTD